MINSLFTSLLRVTFVWYVIGILVLFIGPASWAEEKYKLMLRFPWVPEIELNGLSTAANVQANILFYWTGIVLAIGATSFFLGYLICEIIFQYKQWKLRKEMAPRGNFRGVSVASYSMGTLPFPIVPERSRQSVVFEDSKRLGWVSRLFLAKSARIKVSEEMKAVIDLLTPNELALCTELIQQLLAAPMHYAGAGHGVGLLEHSLNVTVEAAKKCTPTFKLPLIAALAHDIGKLITFKPDGKGGWKREGLHTRESARILATLPAFGKLPEAEQRALLLAIKYDHAPNKMPQLAGDKESSMLAMRIISALTHADKIATAEEKERHLERVNPEDLLWKDFVDNFREASVVSRGIKRMVSNQVNNPSNSPYVYLYEMPWREAALARLPEEVAAALDLTRRDRGKIAKYSKILLDRLRQEGVLVESVKINGEKVSVPPENPLWDIKSGEGEKAVVFKGAIVLDADKLWKKLNYKLGIYSPYAVTIVGANSTALTSADPAEEPQAAVEVEGLKVNIEDAQIQKELGLGEGSGPSRSLRRILNKKESKKVSDKENLLQSLIAEKPQKTPTKEIPPPEETTSIKEPGMERKDVSTATEKEISPEVVSEHAETKDLNSIEDPAEVIGDSESVVAPSEVEVECAPEIKNEELESVKEPISESVEAVEPTVAPVQAEELPTPPPPRTQELSQAEIKLGLAIAGPEDILKYPHLSIGSKFYTEKALFVQAGKQTAGAPYPAKKETGVAPVKKVSQKEESKAPSGSPENLNGQANKSLPASREATPKTNASSKPRTTTKARPRFK